MKLNGTMLYRLRRVERALEPRDEPEDFDWKRLTLPELDRAVSLFRAGLGIGPGGEPVDARELSDDEVRELEILCEKARP